MQNESFSAFYPDEVLRAGFSVPGSSHFIAKLPASFGLKTSFVSPDWKNAKENFHPLHLLISLKYNKWIKSPVWASVLSAPKIPQSKTLHETNQVMKKHMNVLITSLNILSYYGQNVILHSRFWLSLCNKQDFPSPRFNWSNQRSSNDCHMWCSSLWRKCLCPEDCSSFTETVSVFVLYSYYYISIYPAEQGCSQSRLESNRCWLYRGKKITDYRYFWVGMKIDLFYVDYAPMWPCKGSQKAAFSIYMW